MRAEIRKSTVSIGLGTDKASFHLIRHISCQNMRLWITENHYFQRDWATAHSWSQYRKHLTPKFCDFSTADLLGPYLFKEHCLLNTWQQFGRTKMENNKRTYQRG